MEHLVRQLLANKERLDITLLELREIANKMNTSVSLNNPRQAAHIAGEDYDVSRLGDAYHWEGLDSGHGYDDYCSEDGWDTPEEAQADALYWLNRLDTGESHAETIQLISSWGKFSAAVVLGCDRENVNLPPLERLE